MLKNNDNKKIIWKKNACYQIAHWSEYYIGHVVHIHGLWVSHVLAGGNMMRANGSYKNKTDALRDVENQ